jgi:hypothetical protein
MSILISFSTAAAQVQVSGLLDIVFRNAEEPDIVNLTFKNHSNFHTIRTRLFFDSPLSENSALFVQLLTDQSSIVPYGAFLRVERLLEKNLNLNIGYIPATVGTYAARTYSDKNPLIGTPLLYNHHSNIVPGRDESIRNVVEFLDERGERYNTGLPVIYDACWNTGLELYGSIKKFDYSLGILAGAVSLTSVEQKKEVPQFTTRLAYNFSPGLVLGGSAFFGPYLSDQQFDDILPPGRSFADYINAGAGYDLYFAHRMLEIYSETFYALWEYPYLPDLKVVAGYLEAKYKFAPGWYGAARFDFFEPSEIDNGDGGKEKWDYPLKRYEFGIGYKPGRNVTVKLVTQLNRFDINDYFDSNLYALQISTGF